MTVQNDEKRNESAPMESKIDGLAQQNYLIDDAISRNEENDESGQVNELIDEPGLLDGLHVATYNLAPQGY